VGDSVVDLDLARAVPMPAVAVTWGLADERRLAASGAAELVREPRQLRRWVGAPAP
jgi:phosphoglycolate phosphatase-like HAD superfamily hydrolase